MELLSKKEVQGMVNIGVTFRVSYSINRCIMQTSLLVVPQAFIECEVRVYDKRRLKDRANDDEEALR